MLGECVVFGYDCKYHYEPPFLYLIPNNLVQYGEIYRKLVAEIRSKKLMTIFTKKSYQEKGGYAFIVSKVFIATKGDGVRLNVVYYIERYSDDSINQMRFASEVFTKFIEIPSYYYFRRIAKVKLLKNVDDLLYSYDTINSFDFMVKNVPVFAEIKVGGILCNGIASDLKLKTYLVLSFNPQEDEEFIIKLAESIRKALCFFCYSRNVDLNAVDLVNNHDGKTSINGVIRFRNDVNEKYQRYYFIHSSYQYFEPQLGQFFNSVVNDKELYLRHLPGYKDIYFGYDVIRLVNLFSAFENEYNKLPKSLRNKDSSSVGKIRDNVIKHIRMAEKDANDDLEKSFIKKSEERIRQIDTVYGEIQKIVNAYNQCSDYLDKTMDFWKVDAASVTDISKRLCSLRDKIVHNNYEDSLDDQQTKMDIAFLEWLTYAMLLHRYDIYDIDNILKEMFC